MKKYKLIASNLPDLSYERISFDPLDMNGYTTVFEVVAIDEKEAISKFQATNIYSQFCDKYLRPYTYIKGEDEDTFRSIEE